MESTSSEQIEQFLFDKINLEILSRNTDLIESGVLDSRTLAELLVHLERQFGIEISVDNLDIENFRTIASTMEFVLAHL